MVSAMRRATKGGVGFDRAAESEGAVRPTQRSETFGASDGALSAEASGRRHWWLVGLAGLVLVAGAAVVLGVTRRDSSDESTAAAEAPTTTALDPTWQPGPCPPPRSRDDMTSEEQLESSRRSREAMSEARRTGWAQFRGERGDGSGWFCGWIRYPPPFDPAEMARSGGKEPVYDAIDGAIIGYSFAALGVFTPEEVAAPGFDPAVLRVARHGCDPIGNPSCRPVMGR